MLLILEIVAFIHSSIRRKIAKITSLPSFFYGSLGWKGSQTLKSVVNLIIQKGAFSSNLTVFSLLFYDCFSTVLRQDSYNYHFNPLHPHSAARGGLDILAVGAGGPP